jgi:hypothetical protein
MITLFQTNLLRPLRGLDAVHRVGREFHTFRTAPSKRRTRRHFIRVPIIRRVILIQGGCVLAHLVCVRRVADSSKSLAT